MAQRERESTRQAAKAKQEEVASLIQTETPALLSRAGASASVKENHGFGTGRGAKEADIDNYLEAILSPLPPISESSDQVLSTSVLNLTDPLLEIEAATLKRDLTDSYEVSSYIAQL